MVDKVGKHVQSLHPPAVFSMNHVCIVALLEAAFSVEEVFLVHLTDPGTHVFVPRPPSTKLQGEGVATGFGSFFVRFARTEICFFSFNRHLTIK